MDETYTPPNEEKKSFDQHVNDALELQDAAEAARRRFAVDEPAVTRNPQVRETSPNATPASRPLEPGESSFFRKHPGLAVTGLVGVAALGVGGLAALDGGSSNGAERGSVDDTINSITLSPDAHLRSDPFVGDPKDNTYNDVLDLGAKVTIDVNHDIRVLNDTDKGTWYGIPIADIEAVAPNAASVKDNDGMLWVNHLGVESINTDEQQAAQ